jgi:hypothetical protein
MVGLDSLIRGKYSDEEQGTMLIYKRSESPVIDLTQTCVTATEHGEDDDEQTDEIDCLVRAHTNTHGHAQGTLHYSN